MYVGAVEEPVTLLFAVVTVISRTALVPLPPETDAVPAVTAPKDEFELKTWSLASDSLRVIFSDQVTSTRSTVPSMLVTSL